MTILEERGLFWWQHEPVPVKQVAPVGHVSGLLKIDENGEVTLELDGCLVSDEHMSKPLISLEEIESSLRNKRIRGLLTNNGKAVILDELNIRRRKSIIHGPSVEEYNARHCLIGDLIITNEYDTLTVSGFEIDLQGFEEWLRIGNIRTKRIETEIIVTHSMVNDLVYTQPDGELKIIFNIISPVENWRDHYAELKELVAIDYCFAIDVSLGNIVEEIELMQSFFMLLTNSERSFVWPIVKKRNGLKVDEATFYFYRSTNTDNPPKSHELPTNFLQIKDTFGTMFTTWKTRSC